MQSKQTLQTSMVVGALAACAAGFACQTWDLAISQWVQKIRIPGDFRKAIRLSETFGHSSGVIAIFATLLWIDLKNRRKLWQAALCTLICGIAANVAKLFIPRYRPHSVDQSEFEIVSSWQTWGTPWTGSWFEEEFRSFPSGHSATAVALAIGLTQVYPRGKWIFTTLAGAACLQRLESNAHFLSDIMGGIMITMVISLWYWKVPSSSKIDSNCDFRNSIDHPNLVDE